MAKARDTRYTTRPFAVGAFAFVVDTTDDEDRLLLESLFGDLPEPDGRAPEPSRFSFVRERGRRSWAVHGPRLDTPPDTTLDAAMKWLLTAVNLCALDAEPEYLHLHAAAAAHEDRVVVMSAARETGKTTTVAHLVALGWGFVTDETVRLSEQSPEITGFPKPLSIKPRSRGLLGHLDRWMIPPAEADDAFRFVPIGATGATVVRGGLPGLVVLLRRAQEGHDTAVPAVRWLHPADAVVALMQETIDAERFGAAAAQLARLVSAIHTVELTMGTPAETVHEIESLFRRTPPTPLEISVLPASDACGPGVTTVGVGERVVIHDATTGRIFALDEGGARIWRQLGGWTTGDGIDLDGPVIGPFVEQLRSFGVLADAG